MHTRQKHGHGFAKKTRPINIKTHPKFTIDEIISATGWDVPSQAYKRNMAKALAYFQDHIPKSKLRELDDAGPWNLKINGQKIRLLNWMQGIDFHSPVNPQRTIKVGDPVIAFKEPGLKKGSLRGKWYTFPSTKMGQLAIARSQTRIHKFQAKRTFTCMQSRVSDAFVAWVRDMPAEYRRGGGQQLFIEDAQSKLKRA